MGRTERKVTRDFGKRRQPALVVGFKATRELVRKDGLDALHGYPFREYMKWILICSAQQLGKFVWQ
jgi:hypothetical protein